MAVAVVIDSACKCESGPHEGKNLTFGRDAVIKPAPNRRVRIFLTFTARVSPLKQVRRLGRVFAGMSPAGMLIAGTPMIVRCERILPVI